MIKNIFFVLFIFFANISAQISLNVDSVFFPQSLTGTSDSLSFYIINSSQQPVSLEIENIKSVYSVSDYLLTIPAYDSALIEVEYFPYQNVVDKDIIIISSTDSTIGTIINIYGSGIFDDAYDAATFNLYDTQLKTALNGLVNGHTSLGYNLARDKMFMEIDNKKVNGQGATQNTLECVYTGRLAVGYIDRADAQNNYSFNTEHTWPQSTFNENEPMKSDLYHLFPTDVTANGVRANYPFGNAVSGINWQVGGSKLGLNYLNQTVFEPRDVHKGNVSRSMFYFTIRYPQNYGGFFTQVQEEVFREWNIFDGVDSIEIKRNNDIAALQMKRNPFIDHPEFVERIYSFATNIIRPVNPEIAINPLKIIFDSTQIGTTSNREFYIANKGSGELIIDSVVVADERFSINLYSTIIEEFNSEKVLISFSPDSVKNYFAPVTFYTNGGSETLAVKGIGKDNINSVHDFINHYSFSLEQNYPNPFNPTTKIKFEIPYQDLTEGRQVRDDDVLVILKVYDILGRELTTLVNEERPAGKYEIEFNAAQLPSGIYFYKLSAGKFIETKKMIFIK